MKCGWSSACWPSQAIKWPFQQYFLPYSNLFFISHQAISNVTTINVRWLSSFSTRPFLSYFLLVRQAPGHSILYTHVRICRNLNPYVSLLAKSRKNRLSYWNSYNNFLNIYIKSRLQCNFKCNFKISVTLRIEYEAMCCDTKSSAWCTPQGFHELTKMTRIVSNFRFRKLSTVIRCYSLGRWPLKF